MTHLGNTDKLFSMFKRAKKAGLQEPQLRFKVNGRKIGILESRFRENTLVVMAKQPSKALGFIDTQGQYKETKVRQPIELVIALTTLVRDVKQAAKDIADTHHMCMFCSKPLTDDRSTEVGYGPQCAETWGLPWGDKDNDEEPIEEFDGDLEDYF